MLVGLTFTALASGATERVLRAHFDGAKVACLRAIIQALNWLLLPGLGNPQGVEEVGGLGASIIGA